MPLATIQAVAGALELSIDLRLRSRDGDIDRLVNSRHAALAEAVIAWIVPFGGWAVRAEVSFSIFGERGIIDLVAWHEATRALLVIELKTGIVDVGETIGTFDRKIRLAARVAADLGWRPVQIGAALIVAGSATNRRGVAAHRGTFRSAYPDGIVALRSWLRAPAVASRSVLPSALPPALRALAFFSDNHHRNVRSGFASVRRVRPAARRPPEHEPRTDRRPRGAMASSPDS
jgi:hypothetical protein